MAEKPRIGIPDPTSSDAEYNHRSWPEYAAAVRGAGGDPVRLPLEHTPAELSRAIRSCSGYLLPGSPADVEPQTYGQVRESDTAPADPLRTNCDRRLLEDAERTGKPLLGVCFGLQFMNVWRGGTLVQDLQPLPVNHGAGPSVAVAHSVLVEPESLLGSLLAASETTAEGEYRRLPVNSSHHQAIAIPGDELTVTARSSQDGVIEAVEGRIGLSSMVGVQWHPERGTELSAASRSLFLWLISESLDYRERQEN